MVPVPVVRGGSGLDRVGLVQCSHKLTTKHSVSYLKDPIKWKLYIAHLRLGTTGLLYKLSGSNFFLLSYTYNLY